MRALAALLLLAMLPGLALPPGASLHVCLCAFFGASVAGGPGGCCAHHGGAAPEDRPARRGCCGDRAPAPAPQGTPHAEPAAPGACHCVTFVVPDDPQAQAAEARPNPPRDAALPAAVGAAVVTRTIPRATALARPWPASAERPPPPGCQRSLPLRL